MVWRVDLTHKKSDVEPPMSLCITESMEIGETSVAVVYVPLVWVIIC